MCFGSYAERLSADLGSLGIVCHTSLDGRLFRCTTLVPRFNPRWAEAAGPGA